MKEMHTEIAFLAYLISIGSSIFLGAGLVGCVMNWNRIFYIFAPPLLVILSMAILACGAILTGFSYMLRARE